MRIFKPVLYTGIAALLASVLGLSASADAAIVSNALNFNALTANALTLNALTLNSLTLYGLAPTGTAAEAALPPLRGLTLPSGASFVLPN